VSYTVEREDGYELRIEKDTDGDDFKVLLSEHLTTDTEEDQDKPDIRIKNRICNILNTKKVR
jgi:hypothetical protein